jgi:hypothetical protein
VRDHRFHTIDSAVGRSLPTLPFVLEASDYLKRRSPGTLVLAAGYEGTSEIQRLVIASWVLKR